MQKNNKKASILIWAIFLSLIISISFLSISTKITKNIKNASKIDYNLEKQNTINNILKSSNNDEEYINNKTTIYIENKTLKKSLKKDEIYKIIFPNSSKITLELTNSGIILFNTGGSNTGILNNTNNYIETNININKKLILENYSGYSSFELNSDNKFDIIEKKYKIIEKIGNKEIIKSFGTLK